MKILFLCTLNAVRSPIAAHLAKSYHPEHEFYSAGLVAGAVDYFAVEVMEEIGIDIKNHKPRAFKDLKNKQFDLVVCLAGESKNDLTALLKRHHLKHEIWEDIPSPGTVHGNRLMKIFGYREIRDKLKSHIRNWKII